MNRWLFIFSMTALIATAIYIEDNEIANTWLLVFLGTWAITILRRVYLQIRPWWGGDLEDIPKYFMKP